MRLRSRRKLATTADTASKMLAFLYVSPWNFEVLRRGRFLRVGTLRPQPFS
jgi:hypothetical protein